MPGAYPSVSQHQRHQSHREVRPLTLAPAPVISMAASMAALSGRRLCTPAVFMPSQMQTVSSAFVIPSRIGEYLLYPSKCSLAISNASRPPLNANVCVQLRAVAHQPGHHPSPRTSIPSLLIVARTLFIHLSIPVPRSSGFLSLLSRLML